MSAREALRVTRPGGAIGLINWTPQGHIGRILKAVGATLPKPPGYASPAPLWGEETHVDALFATEDVTIEHERRLNPFVGFTSPEDWVGFMETSYGPLLTARAKLEPTGAWPPLRDADPRHDRSRRPRRPRRDARGLRVPPVADPGRLDSPTMTGPRTTVRLCGPLRLEIDGRDVAAALPGGQAGTLLSYLLAGRERAADRDELVDLLWPERPPRDPGAALRPLLSRLRRALAPATLEGRERLRLALPEPVSIDLDEAARAIAAARAAAQDARWSEVREQSETVLGLLGPGLLPGQEGDWLEARRRELAELELEALEWVARSGLELGGTGLGAAARASRELIERSPFREAGHRLLMEALAGDGNVAEALRAYDALRVLLRDELGTSPAADVQALHMRLLAGEGAGRAPAPAGPVELPAPLALTSRLPFAGRAGELATLRAQLPWDEGAGRRAVLIGGEAGSGKSRLVREFAAEVAAGGVLVLHGACDPMVRAPYGPFVEALDHLTRVSGAETLRAALGPTHGELVRLLPDLPARTGEPAAPVEADPDTERHRLHTAVTDLLAGIGRDRPLLLVLEDAHWADVPTLDLVRHLVRAGGRTRLLLVVTFRDTEADMPDALAEALADVRRTDDVVRLRLAGLSGDELGEFVRRAAGTDRDAPELTSAIGELTGGNAFLVCELWHTLVDGDVIEVGGGGLRLTRPLAELGSPDSVRELVGLRLARLEPATRELLELAATAGAEFDLEALGAGGPAAPVEALDEAVRSGLIEELPSGGLVYRFAHELLRRALYDGLTRARRAALHLRVGEALERSGDRSGRRLADLAHHFAAAAPVGGAARGVEYNVLAARAADGALAFDEAAERLRVALELGIGDAARRAEILLELGAVRHRAGRAQDALAAYAEAAGVARELGDATLLARAAIGFEQRLLAPGDHRSRRGRAARGGGRRARRRALAAARRRPRRARPRAR